MGWFKELFSLVQKNSQLKQEPQIISLEKLPLWWAEKHELLLEKHAMHAKIEKYAQKLKEKRWELECKLEDWEKKIPSSQAESVQELFAKTHIFIETITFSQPLVVDSFISFHKNFEEQLNTLLQILEQHSFLKDFSYLLDQKQKRSAQAAINPLLEYLLFLRGLSEQFNVELAQTKVNKQLNLSLSIEKLRSLHTKIEELKESIRGKQVRYELALSRKEDKERALSAILELPNYAQSLAAKEELDKQVRLLSKIGEEILHLFSSLKLVLPKISNPSPLLLSYSNDPQNAFTLDESLTIISLLHEINTPQTEQFVTVQQFAEIQKILEYARSGYIAKLRHRYILAKRDLLQLQENPPNQVLLTKIEEGKYRFEHFANQVTLLEEQVLLLSQELEIQQKKLVEIKTEIEESFLTLLNQPITISH